MKYTLRTLSTKLGNFLKFLHRRIATNVFLFKIQAVDTDLGCFCQGTQDIFWDCPDVTRGFWAVMANDFLVSVDLMEASGKQVNV